MYTLQGVGVPVLSITFWQGSYINRRLYGTDMALKEYEIEMCGKHHNVKDVVCPVPKINPTMKYIVKVCSCRQV